MQISVEAVAPTFLVPVAGTPPRSVDENSPKDSSILTVEGQDSDGDNLTFSISTQVPNSPPFEIDSLTGLFKTPNGLDAETTTFFNFTFGYSFKPVVGNSFTVPRRQQACPFVKECIYFAQPGRLSGEGVGLMTWWL